MTLMCVRDTSVLGSVLVLCLLRAAKKFMLFRPSSLPRLLAILGKSKLQSFRVWLACVVPNLYLTYPSCSVPLPLPPLTSPISPYLPCSNDINLQFAFLSLRFVNCTLNGSYLLNMISFKSKQLTGVTLDDTEVTAHQFPRAVFLSFPSHTPSHLLPRCPPNFLLSCCFVLAPVAVRIQVLSTSSLWLYSPLSFIASCLPPSSPPVITIITYGSATPLSHSQNGYFYLSLSVRGFYFFRWCLFV